VGISSTGVRHTLQFFADIHWLAEHDVSRVAWLFDARFPFRRQLDLADSLHVHIKVADTARLPEAAILNAGGCCENRQPGYVKYAFAPGVNFIFSSVPVAEDDRLPGAAAVTEPFLDHAGVDLRRETVAVRREFDAVAEVAERNGWRSLAQGGADRAVYCCHTQVNEKRWVYPPADLSAWTRPLEFAFGPLVVHANSMGCDLRPMDPGRSRAQESPQRAAPCCGAQAAAAPTPCCAK